MVIPAVLPPPSHRPSHVPLSAKRSALHPALCGLLGSGPSLPALRSHKVSPYHTCTCFCARIYHPRPYTLIRPSTIDNTKSGLGVAAIPSKFMPSTTSRPAIASKSTEPRKRSLAAPRTRWLMIFPFAALPGCDHYGISSQDQQHIASLSVKKSFQGSLHHKSQFYHPFHTIKWLCHSVATTVVTVAYFSPPQQAKQSLLLVYAYACKRQVRWGQRTNYDNGVIPSTSLFGRLPSHLLAVFLLA